MFSEQILTYLGLSSFISGYNVKLIAVNSKAANMKIEIKIWSNNSVRAIGNSGEEITCIRAYYAQLAVLKKLLLQTPTPTATRTDTTQKYLIIFMVKSFRQAQVCEV